MIFFDVDGVLNTSNFEKYLLKSHLLRLKRIFDETKNSKFIISTSWRETSDALYEILSYCHIIGIDINNDVIGCTPIYILTVNFVI